MRMTWLGKTQSDSDPALLYVKQSFFKEFKHCLVVRCNWNIEGYSPYCHYVYKSP